MFIAGLGQKLTDGVGDNAPGKVAIDGYFKPRSACIFLDGPPLNGAQRCRSHPSASQALAQLEPVEIRLP